MVTQARRETREECGRAWPSYLGSQPRRFQLHKRRKGGSQLQHLLFVYVRPEKEGSLSYAWGLFSQAFPEGSDSKVFIGS
jgi:hypothetical protein